MPARTHEIAKLEVNVRNPSHTPGLLFMMLSGGRIALDPFRAEKRFRAIYLESAMKIKARARDLS